VRYLLAVPAIALCILATNAAYAHFFGATKTIDNYQVIFQPSPSLPVAGDNSTLLNFSILKDGNNIYNSYVALVISDKSSGAPVEQFSYRQYEFSDITVPYTFQSPGDYVVELRTRVADDEKYQAQPLVASFDLSVQDPNQLIPFDELMLFYVTPGAAATAGIVMYLHSKKKI
jgi:hypothetical protein